MHIHFLGIKGSGMVSLARILQMQGNNITGSDVSQAYFTDTILDKMGIEPLLFDIQNAENIAADIVVYSAAYDAENNQEFAAWKQKGTKMLGYSEMIAQVTENQNLVAVTGTHGKTTTSAMLAVVMKGIQDQRKQLGAIECHQPAQNENSFEFSAIIGSGVPQFDGMGGYTSFCHPEQTHCHPEQTHCHPEQTHCHPEQTHCHPEQTHCHPELVSGSNNDSRF
ncbi:MAG: Mur ligase domain-containing protein [Patescibacteria group bacterium]|nr:Mur ligase domain-containing protein [Patescibacteria group bacterium]